MIHLNNNNNNTKATTKMKQSSVSHRCTRQVNERQVCVNVSHARQIYKYKYANVPVSGISKSRVQSLPSYLHLFHHFPFIFNLIFLQPTSRSPPLENESCVSYCFISLRKCTCHLLISAIISKQCSSKITKQDIITIT